MIDRTDYRALSVFVNTNQDSAVQVLTDLHGRVHQSSLPNSQQDDKLPRQRGIKEWDLLSKQVNSRSGAQPKAPSSGSAQLAGEYRGLVETNSDFENVACASAQYLGGRTNPFTNYDSDVEYTKSKLSAVRDGRPSNNRIDSHLVPPPLMLKTGQLPEHFARPVRPPRPDERESFSSSAFSCVENDTPATPLSMEFPTSHIVNYYAAKTRESLSGSYSTTDALHFPMPPLSDTMLDARDINSAYNSSPTDSIPQVSQLLQPAVDMTPSGAIPTSLRDRTFGMPQLPNGKRAKGLIRGNLTVDGARGSVSVVHHLPEVDPKFHPKKPTNPHNDYNYIKDDMVDKLRAKTKLKSNLLKVDFCRGALIGRKAPDEKAYDLKGRPSGLTGSEKYWGCKSCKFEGRAVKVPTAKGKTVLDIDRNVYGSNGILYRWEFLFKSHIRMKDKVKHPVNSPFGCVFCCAEGRGTPIFDGVASLLNHLQDHRSGSISGCVEQMTKAILDRSPAVEEDFDIALPPRYI